MSSVWATLIRGLRFALISLLATAAVFALGVLLAPLTGHRVVVLRSGSMAPAISSGSLAIIESVEPGDVRLGDVVTVVLDSGQLLTHRVVGWTSLDGYPALELQGDANLPGAREVVSMDRLAGRVVLDIPAFGYAAWWLTQPGGSIASIALIGLVLVAIGALGRSSGRRPRPSWAVRAAGSRGPLRGPLSSVAGLLDHCATLGLDKPVLALMLNLILVIGAGATLPSAAIFTTSTGIDGNSFTSDTWAASSYRSLASGPWDAAATWQRHNGIAWVAATRPPSGIDGVITIRSAHIVSVTGTIMADEVVVATGGQVAVAASATLTVEDGAGTDLSISGTVDAAGSLTIGSGAEAALESGGVLLDSGMVNGAGSLIGRSGTVQASGGPRTITLPITLATTLAVSGSEDLRLSGVLSDVGSLTKSGTGTLTLGGIGTYTGVTTINGGTLRLGIDDAIGPSSATTVASGAVVDLAGFDETVGSLAGAGSVTSSTGGAVLLTVGGNGVGTGTFSGVIGDGSGTLALTKVGSGTLTLSGNSTFSGRTTISAGVVSINSDSSLGAAPGSPTPGQLTIGTGTLTTTATMTLDADRGVALTGTASVSVASATTLTYDGVLAGSGALVKTSTGTLALGGVNTYSGTTTISSGVVSIAAASALGAVPGSPTPGHLMIGAGTLATTGDVTFSGNRGLALTGAATFSIATATTLTVPGIATGTGTLTKTGTGTLTLSGANTYTGLTTITTGVVRVQHASALGTTAGATTVASGTALEIDGSGLTIAEPVTSLIGTGVSAAGAIRNLANSNTWSGAITIGSGNATVNADAGLLTLGAIGGATRTLTVGGNGDTTVGGIIATTTGTLVKNGTGTLILSAANTYTGTTTVNAGAVRLDGSTGTGAVSVVAGAILGGSGTIGGAVTVSGTLQPGAPPGRLTSVAVTMSANSTYRIDIGGTTVATQYSQGRVSGTTVTIQSSVTLSLVKIGAFTPTSGQTFTILDKVGAGAISGTFNGLAEAATISDFLGSGLNARISYIGGDGNDIVITVL